MGSAMEAINSLHYFKYQNEEDILIFVAKRAKNLER